MYDAQVIMDTLVAATESYDAALFGNQETEEFVGEAPWKRFRKRKRERASNLAEHDVSDVSSPERVL